MTDVIDPDFEAKYPDVFHVLTNTDIDSYFINTMIKKANARLRHKVTYGLASPLTAIRAFEVAARLRSFAEAAAELNVTHWAVGKQIRLLEDWMGIPLFGRRPREVVLTEEGAEPARR